MEISDTEMNEELMTAYSEGRKDERECWLPVLEALKTAEQWLTGWATAESELRQIRAALEKVS